VLPARKLYENKQLLESFTIERGVRDASRGGRANSQTDRKKNTHSASSPNPTLDKLVAKRAPQSRNERC
jgi:hypothetical protein